MTDELAFRLIGQAELGEQAVRALELKGEIPRLVSPSLDWSINAEDFTNPEFLWLRRMGRYIAGADQIAVAAQFNIVQIGRPTGGDRGALAVIEEIFIGNKAAVANDYRTYLSPYPGAGAFTGIPGNVDDRQANVQSNYQVFAGAVGALPAPVNGSTLTNIPAGGSFRVPVQYVLTGQQILNITNAGVNQPMLVWVRFRERLLLTSER